MLAGYSRFGGIIVPLCLLPLALAGCVDGGIQASAGFLRWRGVIGKAPAAHRIDRPVLISESGCIRQTGRASRPSHLPT